MEGKRQKGRSVCSMCLDLRFELIFETENLETGLFEAQINVENIFNNKLVNNIKAGGTDKKTDVFYFLPERDILSSF